MSSSDWDRILKVKTDQLNSMSPDDIDIIYELMVNIDDISNVDDADKLYKAFNIAQFIMSYKAEENKGLNEDLEEANVDIKKLKIIKEELEKENAALQRSDGTDINVVREKRNWEMEKESMNQEIRELKSKYNSLTEDNDKKEETINKQQKEIEGLKDSNAKLSDNVEFLRQRTNQLKNQKDQNQDSNKSELAYTRSELRQKKIDLDNAQEKILELHQEMDHLKENLEMATDEIERITSEYKNMKSNFGMTDGDLQSREAECRMLRMQIEHLQEQMNDRNDADDKIMIHVNEQVEKWKQIMEERDSEICRLYEENAKLRYDLQKSGINSEKANVQALIKLVKEREQEVKDLSQQLLDAAHTIEENGDLIENLKKDLERTGGGSSGHQMRRIKELRQMLDDKEKMLRETVERLNKVENQMADREQELTDALERNKMYERGEFGLAEAVAEIKACKAQLQVKEREKEQYLQNVNKANYAAEELKFENGHLRAKLNIPIDEQLDVEGYRRQKAAEDEEERAINIVLQKEIEKLEDERLLLKKKVRMLARQAGLRAGSAGMEAGDVMDAYKALELESSMQNIEYDPVMQSMARKYESAPQGNNTWRIKEREMSSELSNAVKERAVKEDEIAKLMTRNRQLQTENDAMCDALRQIKEELVTRNWSAGAGVPVLECPVLDKLLVAMETRKLLGEFDTGIYLKTRIDNLEGRNEELRNELRNSRIGFQQLQLDHDKLKQRLKVMDPMVMMENGWNLEERIGLPENLSASASQTIAALNQHLIIVLQEKSLKEQALDKADRALDNYRRKFAFLRHRQGLLYRQYGDEKQRYEQEIEALQTRLKDIEGIRSEDNARIAEFDRMLDTLNQDDSELKRRLADLCRQITVLKVNETALTRRYSAMQEMEQTMRRENNKLKSEMIQIEAVVTDRMGYYRRFKETANYKLNVLQKELDESVPRKDMTKLQTKFDEVTEKYRNFLEKQNILIGRGESIIQIESELSKMKMDHEALKKILEAEKQRRHVLEATLEELGEAPASEQSIKSTSNSPRKTKSKLAVDSHLISMSKKMATLEMKQINEQERADHAVRMYENIKNTWNEAEKRNKELEEKLTELTNHNLELQKIERELRDELIDSVSKEINDAEKRRVLELEKRELEGKHEIEKLKEIAEIATMQTNALQQQQLSREKETGSLRQQLADIQCQSDEKSLIGKLHRHIVLLQMSETSALRKLDDLHRVQKRLEAQLLRTEQNCDEKDQNLYQTRLDGRTRVKHLRETINSLRSQFSGSIPLSRHERFTSTLIRLTEDKVKLDQELQLTLRAKFDLETEFQVANIARQTETELKDAMATKRNEKSVLESWSSKMEGLRLESLKHKRQCDLLRHEVEHLESVIKCQESQLAQVDEDIARITRDHDDKQLLWEQRENELERTIVNLENIQGEVIIAANSFQQATGTQKEQYLGTLPDPSAPLPNQLDQAMATIKKHIRVIFDKENENKALRKHGKEHENKIRELEGTLLKRERYINELRLRLPASEDRPQQMGQISDAAVTSLLNAEKSNYVDEKTMWAAQTTLSGLQERLRAKDESLMRYEQLLKEAREDLVVSNQKHGEEIKLLRERLSAEAAAGTRRAGYNGQLPMATTAVATSDQYRENNELRDLLAIQTRTNEDLKLQLADIQHQLSIQKQKMETTDKINQSRLKETEIKTENEIIDLKENMNNLKRKLNEKESQIEFQNQEISRLKGDVTRSPNVEMKNAMVKLTEQLRDKEKQLQILKANLADVKKTITDQSIDALRMTKNEMANQDNIQKVLDKHTRDLSNELEANRDQILQYQRELRSARADKERVQIELDGLKADSDHKEFTAKKLKTDKSKLEQENDELRNQLQRIKNLRNLSSNDAMKQELDAMKIKLRLIEEENNQLKRNPAKSANSKQDSQEKVNNWEEGKRNQRLQDKLKEKLQDKENDIANLSKQLDTTTKALDRMRREKQAVENRLTDKWGPGALLDIDEDIERISAQPRKPMAFATPSNRSDTVDDLRRRNGELEKEIDRLMRNADSSDSKTVNNVALKEAEMRNRILQRNIEDLERRLTQSGSTSVITLEKEKAMQKEIMRLNGDNLELKFEAEAARKEIPRLKEKVTDQKKFIDLLKSEKEALEGKSNRSLESSASTMSNIKRVGDSGKSTKELEKMIGRMKKVVEKTQRENERLKEAPGVIMNEQVQLLRTENADLKLELAALKEQVGHKLAERYDAKERGMARVVSDYEKLRKDLGREAEEHEKTRIDLKQMARDVDKLEKQNADLESKLAISESRGRQNVSRIANKELQDENRKLSSIIANLQSQLKDKHNQNPDSSKVEELKLLYNKATERVSFLEKQLQSFSEQFGVAIDLGY
uniref:NPHP6 n=1 Tax=Schmidtea mediterranea TaxID=79327 RepID=A0A0H3YKK9_SCHMD|nr:NPHP6 [Schmidtea mediterranea]